MQGTFKSNRFPSVFLIAGVALAAVVPAVGVFSTEKRHAPQRVARPPSGQRAVDDDLRGGVDGACCQGELCTVETEPACTDLGGVWRGSGTDCTPNCCPVDFPTGSDCACATSTCEVDAGATNTGFVCDPANGDADCGPGQSCVLRCVPEPATQLRHPFECVDDFGSPLDPPIPCDPANGNANCPPIPCIDAGDCPLGMACVADICEDTTNMTCDQSFSTSVMVTKTDSIDSFFGVLDGDACSLNTTSDGVGWYELINLVDPTPGDGSDDCFILTVGLCCSDPVSTPIWPFLSSFRNCPCTDAADVIATAPDVDISGDQLDGFGVGSKARIAGRCDDDNYSATFTVPPGDYAYQINADKSCADSAIPCDTDDDCPGTTCVASNPAYTVHFTVESCRIAACCVNETCDVTNRLDCLAQGGNFLGDGDQPVFNCQAFACTLGSCCVDGTCNDDEFHDEQAECEAQSGVYIGGLTCNDDPCPTCPFDSAANCQQVQTVFGAVPLMDRNPENGSSNGTFGTVLADDVKFGGSQVDQICWNTGFFASPCCGNGGCVQNIDATWQIRVYDTDPDCDALPGTEKGMSSITVLNKVEGAGQAEATWHYSGSLDNPITLPNGGFAGDTYWFEVSAFGATGCEVRAIWSRDHGNEHYVSAQIESENDPRDYNIDGIGDVDVGFCENSGILSPDAVLGSCCICPANCGENLTRQECDTIRGVWLACATCAETPCGGAPDNDDCGSPFLVSNVPESIDGVAVLTITNENNICATDDGPGLSSDPDTGGCSGSLGDGGDMHNDVWYSYEASACGDLTIESCGAADFDQMVAVYDASNGCPLTDADELACGDDTCGLTGGPATVTLRVAAGQEYLIRIGGWNNEVPGGFDGDPRGTFDLNWSLTIGVCPEPKPPFLKNRYISIDPGDVSGQNPGPFDIRLTLTGTLVDGVPAGQIGSRWWAGPPDANCISMVGPTRQCDPPDWSACPIIHLTGCPIIPTSTYDIVAIVGETVSDPLSADTQAKPGIKFHGDCVGSFSGTEWSAPNGQTNIDDAVAAIKTFQNPSNLPGCGLPPCNATHTSVTDVAPNLPPAAPNKIVNIEDVLIIILGFGGQEYPGGDLALCEDVPGSCPELCEVSPEGTPCDDGDVCTIGDTCQEGECVSGELDTVCDELKPGSGSNEFAMPCECSTCGADTGITGLLDPVNLFSGEFYESVVDLQIPGRGIDFIWGRKYRSKVGPDTAMGNGWDFSYNVFLEQAGPNLIVHNGDTRPDTYLPQADGTWTRAEFFRVIEVNSNPGSDPFTLTFPDTGEWRFHPFDLSAQQGKISAIVDRNGNTISFTYDGLGRLVTIHDPLDTAAHDRDITIEYDGSGADAKIVSVNDFAGRSVTYTYYDGVEPGGNAGDLKCVSTPKVVFNNPDFPNIPPGHDYPDGKTTCYTYSTGFQDDRLNGNLLTITDPKGQTYLTNEYDALDRVFRQFWGNQATAMDPDTIDIVYVDQVPSASNNFAIMKAIVNDRVGNVKELFYDAGNRGVIEREYSGRADPDLPTTESDNRPTGRLRPSDPPFFETRYEYNSDSLRTKTIDANGNQHVRTYDDTNGSRRSQGNLLEECRVPGALGGDQAEICESYEYDDEIGGCCGTNFITKHVDGRGNETTHVYDDRGNRCHTQHRIPSIVEDFTYNEFGQMTSHVLPDNGSGHRRMDVYTYYDTVPQLGYLKDEIVDASAGMAPPAGSCPAPPLPGGPNFALTTTHEYNLVGQTTSVIDPRGHDTRYVVNQLDQTLRSISREVTDGSGLRYERDTFYDPNDNVVRVDIQNIDDQGVLQANTYFTTVYEYDILDYRTASCAEAGDYTGAIPGTQQVPLCTGLPDSEFLSTEYAYDANRNGTLVRYGEAIEGRQPNNVVEKRYDERDLLFQTIRAPGVSGPAGESTDQIDYDANRNVVRMLRGIEDAPRITVLRHDGYDRLWGRDDGGPNDAASVDPMGNEVFYHYDANDNVVTARSEGEKNDIPGDADNVRLSEKTHEYDLMDRLKQTEVEFFDTETQMPVLIVGVPTQGKVTTVTEWSDNSQVTAVVNDNRNRTETTFDTVNRRSVVTDELENAISYTYDANSNVAAITDLEKSTLDDSMELFSTSHDYDGLDRLITTTDNYQNTEPSAEGNTNAYKYDSRNNRTVMTDALSHETRRVYDGINRLITTIRDLDDDGADGDGTDITTTQSWDDSSRLTGQGDDNGNVTAYEYDALNRMTAEVYADTTVHLYTYDIHDNRLTTTDANGSVAESQDPLDYDLLDRLTRKDITVGAGVSNDTTFVIYRYDGLSRHIHVQDDDSVVTRSYDSLSRVTSETLNGQTTNCLFDGVGNDLLSTYPGGRVIECSYDGLERKKTITDSSGGGSSLVASYEYVGPGRVERREYGNGTRSEYTYNGITGIPNSPNDFGVKRIIGTSHTVILGGAVIDDRTFTWDKMYNKTQRKDVRTGGLTHDYSYDDIYRLIQTTVTAPGPVMVRNTIYTLDGVGNRSAVAGTPDPGPYTMDPTQPEPADFQTNQYTTTSVDARAYDKNGNLVRIDDALPTQRDIQYDYRNQMVEYLVVATGVRHSYAYDALGRRTVRVVDADAVPVETRYFYDGRQVFEEQDQFGFTQATYVYGVYIDEVLNVQRSGADFYYHTDDLYNVLALTNAAAGLVERYEYADYGQPVDPTTLAPIVGDPSAIGNPFLFTGRRYDLETGWYYYRTRYLDPIAGRFTARDTLGIWTDVTNLGNGSAYVHNSPWVLVDPHGTKPPTLDWKTVIKVKANPGNCGEFTWAIQWKLSKETLEGGWIIQKVTVRSHIKDCERKKKASRQDLTQWPLWEAWRVNKGQKVTDGIENGGTYDDMYHWPTEGTCTRGRISIAGRADFYEGLDLPKSFKADNSKPSGSLPATNEDPGLSSNKRSMRLHKIHAHWKCCPGPKKTKATTTKGTRNWAYGLKR